MDDIVTFTGNISQGVFLEQSSQKNRNLQREACYLAASLIRSLCNLMFRKDHSRQKCPKPCEDDRYRNSPYCV